MKTSQIYIIEHLEPELFEWCLIEYKHISKIVGKENFWITNIREADVNKLNKYCKVITSSLKSLNLDNKNICILDPEAKKTLVPEDKNLFSYFIFGGILGDSPPKKRTKEELTKFFPNAEKRNIGKAQMSTDNAVYVVSQIAKGIPIEKIPFKDEIEIPLREGESTILPYRYAFVKDRPFISKELICYLKKKDL